METVVLVQIHLNHPTKEQGEGAVLNFVFGEQPAAADILEAYANDPLLQKLPDFHVFGGTLSQCLNTYGVPRLNKMNLTDADGYHLAIPMVQAEWRANIGGRVEYAMNHCFGGIRVMLREIKPVQKCGNEPDEPVKAKAEVKKAKPVKTAGVKARGPSSRGLPAVGKNGVEKSPPVRKRQSKFLK